MTERAPWGYIFDCPVYPVEIPGDPLALRVVCAACGKERVFSTDNPTDPFPIADAGQWLTDHDCVPDDDVMPLNLASARRTRARAITLRRSLDDGP